MRNLTSYFIAGIIVLVLIGQNYSVFGQTTSLANNVVINEVDINPSGDDSRVPLQWVELYNPTDSPVNIGGWTIGATSGLRNTYTIATGTVIPSQQFLVYTYGPLWFPHVGAIVQLKSQNGTIVDQTPSLTDQQDDYSTWQRIYDGYTTGSQSDWVFKTGTLGSSNGQPTTTTETSPLSMSISTDKQGYVFGDTINISGKVSKLVTYPGSNFIPQTVNLILSSSNGFQKTFTLYPGNNLQFSTSAKIDQVLGFDQGSYKITGSYGDARASTSFSVGSESFVAPPPPSSTTLYMSTDKQNYTISQPIILQGKVSAIIPLTPIKYKVYDPDKILVYQGTLFPDSQGRFTTYNPYQQSTGSSGLLINSVNPTYGIYTLFATYGSTSSSITFTLIPKEIQTSAVIISTDKKVYAPGETVVISGHVNLPGLQNLGLSPSLQIIQTFSTASAGTTTTGNRGVVPNTVNIRTFVNVGSDDTFTYNLVLPGTSDSLGNYRAAVILQNDIAQTDFVVTQNPSTYQAAPSSPFSIITDKSSYALGDTLVISGQVANPILTQTMNAGASVRILVLNSTGQPVVSQGSFINNIFVPTSTALIYSAYPDTNGVFQMKQTIQAGIFQPGNYTLKATYAELTTSTSFTVYNTAPGSLNAIVANIDKKVYGVGDTVQLKGQISSLTGTSSYTVTLLKPDGNQVSFPLLVNNGIFSWSWTIPSTAATGTTIAGDRSSSPVLNPSINVYGIYRITISSDYGNSNLFFQVSQNPQPNAEMDPIAIETDKTDYLSTDVLKISGQVIPTQDAATKEQNTMVQITIFSDTGQKAYRTDAQVKQGGQFHLSVPFQPTVWKTGNYRLYAQYLTVQAKTTFKVNDPFTANSGKLQILLTTDTNKYLPGQTVQITGRTSYIISLEDIDLSIGLTNDTIISEGQVMSKKGYSIPHVTLPFDQFTSFTYDYKIPGSALLGNYTIVALVPFGSFNAYFNVVKSLPAANVTTTNATQITPSNETQAPSEQTIIPSSIGPTQKHPAEVNMIVEKTGKISDSTIPVTLNEKSVNDKLYYPREIDGLLRVNPSDQNAISISLKAQDGTCVIGLASDCSVTSSTVKGGSLYQIVKINDENFLVGYSGTGVRVQQFSIIPVNANDVIPDGKWTVEIIKKDQVTRFYYQITYVSNS